jgi:predicted secreted hydrolase
VSPVSGPARRALLAALAGSALPLRAEPGTVEPRALVFPRDHGAHPDFGIEWWYATGWLQPANAGTAAPAWGFQFTFFRVRTGLAATLDSRFAARQLLFAHAALSELGARRLLHAERIVRWNGDARAARGAAALDDTRVGIGAWHLARGGDGVYRAFAGDEAAGFALRLALAPTQPLLLQGQAGYSRKGPARTDASHYYSQPQLAVEGELARAKQAPQAVRGRAWLDHEWSSSPMPQGAVGWDWIGFNLDDGSALTAFRLRDAQGAALWAGGSQRAPGGAVRAFASDELRFEALARWTSVATGASYPVRWRLHCPAGEFEVRALIEAQELDARASTGSVYWEGLSELLDAAGKRLGLGYLEMTGYAGPLRL